MRLFVEQTSYPAILEIILDLSFLMLFLCCSILSNFHDVKRIVLGSLLSEMLMTCWISLMVYASNNQIIVMVSAICGPCQVLHVDKFKETKRRSQVVSSDSRLHPIFFCRFVSDPLIFSLALVSVSRASKCNG